MGRKFRDEMGIGYVGDGDKKTKAETHTRCNASNDRSKRQRCQVADSPFSVIFMSAILHFLPRIAPWWSSFSIG
jgi:hypothetical protein